MTMRRLRLAFTLALIGLPLWAGYAQAGFIAAAVVAAAGVTGFAGTVVTALGTLALNVGLGYAVSALFTKPHRPPPDTGFSGGAKLDLRADADVPRSFGVGRFVTAGSLVYANTTGSRGDIDNSDMVEIIACADCRLSAFVQAYVEEKKVTLTAAEGDEGFKVDGYKDHLFLKFYDGTQTTADALAVTKFSNAANRPWTTAMVGKNVSYVRVHAIYHPSLVPGPLQFKFVWDGMPLYDPRKDGTVGGSGSHRWGVESTYEFSDNPAVIIYNITRGIYVDGAFLYGLKAAANQCPLDTWFAAMNSCDVAMASGDPTKRYRAGGEILVDTEPRDTIRELRKCCGGRFVEIGGIYKLYVDVPELPVYSFTDDDIVGNRDDDFNPILGLEQRVNYITGKYTSPNNWSPKVAPPLADPDLEAADGRRLPANFDAPMINYGPQMQRVMRQLRERGRRERRHRVPLPPSAFHVEPGDVVEWSSARNGYIDKLFEVDGVEYYHNCCIMAAIIEIDPTDYDWVPEFALPEVDGEVIPTVPAPKVIAGFSAVGVTEKGDLDTKKPGIKLTWTPPADQDVTLVHYQVRRPTIPVNIVNGESNDPASGAVVILNALAPLTLYEVRARFNSHVGYDSDWSLWIPVTTPDARLSPDDFEDWLKDYIDHGIGDADDSIRDTVEQVAAILAALKSSTELDKATLTQGIAKAKSDAVAAAHNELVAATGPGSALAASIQSINAAIGAVKAGIKAQFVVGVTKKGTIAAYELATTAQNAKAGMTIVAKTDAVTKKAVGEIHFDADKFMVGKSGVDASFKTVFVIDNTTTPPQILFNGNIITPGSILAKHLKVATLDAISGNFGTMRAGKVILEKKSGAVVVGKMELLDTLPGIMIWDNSG